MPREFLRGQTSCRRRRPRRDDDDREIAVGCRDEDGQGGPRHRVLHRHCQHMAAWGRASAIPCRKSSGRPGARFRDQRSELAEKARGLARAVEPWSVQDGAGVEIDQKAMIPAMRFVDFHRIRRRVCPRPQRRAWPGRLSHQFCARAGSSAPTAISSGLAPAMSAVWLSFFGAHARPRTSATRAATRQQTEERASELLAPPS